MPIIEFVPSHFVSAKTFCQNLFPLNNYALRGSLPNKHLFIERILLALRYCIVRWWLSSRECAKRITNRLPMSRPSFTPVNETQQRVWSLNDLSGLSSADKSEGWTELVGILHSGKHEFGGHHWGLHLQRRAYAGAAQNSTLLRITLPVTLSAAILYVLSFFFASSIFGGLWHAYDMVSVKPLGSRFTHLPPLADMESRQDHISPKFSVFASRSNVFVQARKLICLWVTHNTSYV